MAVGLFQLLCRVGIFALVASELTTSYGNAFLTKQTLTDAEYRHVLEVVPAGCVELRGMPAPFVPCLQPSHALARALR